jgi:hypothetical protein
MVDAGHEVHAVTLWSDHAGTVVGTIKARERRMRAQQANERTV